MTEKKGTALLIIAGINLAVTIMLAVKLSATSDKIDAATGKVTGSPIYKGLSSLLGY